MEKKKEKKIKDVKVYAFVSLRQFGIMSEIKRRTKLSFADQIRAKVRDIEATFDEQNPGFKTN